jgi:Tol biopolymer transport system component/DNA-binding winged helix-turn-helix (wHTH) protein
MAPKAYGTSEVNLRWDRVRFGVFEADSRSGELRKHGMRIRLQGLPFKLLALLLERPGELVTREELQQRIWDDSTVVDFDHSIGSAVNKVREALGDSAESPRYIETLARKGYRFIAPVQVIDNPTAENRVQEISASAIGTGTAVDFSAACAPSILPTVTVPGFPANNLASAATGDIYATRAWKYGLIGAGGLAAMFLLLLSITSVWQGSGPYSSPPVHVTQITWSDRVFPGDVSIESFSGLVTDGARIYFSEVRDGNIALAQSSPAGGESYPLLMPPEVERPSLADIASDGSRFLIQSHEWSKSEESLWIAPSSGGAASRVSAGPAHDAVWAPDGQSILYASGHVIFLASNDGRETRKLAAVSGRAFWMRYSPDGKLIRFTMLDPATRATSLWEMTSEGKSIRLLLPKWNSPASECCGSWTADGKYYVFQSSQNGQSDIWALRESQIPFWLRSSTPFQITAGPLTYLAPLPSHQPNKIFVIGAHSRNHLLQYDSATKQFVAYLPALTTASRTEVSSNGTRVAWVSAIDGSLWQSKLDGGERLQLTSPPMRVYMMRWSADDKKIAFMGKKPGEPWKIYIVPEEGGDPQMLLSEAENEDDPGWSKDGRKIFFGRSPEYMGEDSNPKAIYTYDLETRSLSTVPGSEGLFSPRLSPDGTYLAAMPLDQRKLMLFDFATQKWSILAGKSADNPIWSSDGRSIFFHAFMEEGQPIYRVRLSDQQVERVVDFRNLQPAEAVDYLGLTNKNEPIVSINNWTANLYSLEWNQH